MALSVIFAASTVFSSRRSQNGFSTFDRGLEFGSKLALLAVSTFCCFHRLSPFLMHSRTSVVSRQQRPLQYLRRSTSTTRFLPRTMPV